MFFHLTGIGPAFGQVGFFKRQAPEPIPLAINRFQAESERVLAVLDGVLAKSGMPLAIASPSPTSRISAGCGGGNSAAWTSRTSPTSPGGMSR
jgi:hypothetical protein